MSTDEYNTLISSPFADEVIGGADGIDAVVLEGRSDDEVRDPGMLPLVVAWVGDELGASGPSYVDVVVGPNELDRFETCVARSPIAARTLCVLLRAVDDATVEHALAMESAAYSTLQAGPEFTAWRATSPHQRAVDTAPAVRVERNDAELTITLDRPHRHNAITAQLRDELHAALAFAVSDDSIARIVLRGHGPSFCSGGDLGEFGSRPDPATAHVTRLARSPARVLHHLRARTIVRIHGFALGGGIEMAAFANHVIAAPDTIISLPEIELGLIPGAGGSVSITRRIGRQRTAALALTALQIDARTAQRWNLVDEVLDASVRP
jgi:enoyl-CoA hydratase/carnithine racemase